MKELDDFIRYAKEQFDCDISVEKSDIPDTFERIFGASFLEQQEEPIKWQFNKTTG